MKNQFQLSIFAILFIGLLSSGLYQSCNSTSKEITILYNQEFADIQKIAEQDDKMFCIVLSLPDCPPCGIFNESLGDYYRPLASKVLFNIVDASLPENQWYLQWLCLGSFPSTGIFSSTGELQSVISCSTESCKQCIATAISGDNACVAQFLNRQFPANSEKERTALLNNVLSSKLKFDQGNDISAEIQPFLEQNTYPYPLFLKCFNEEQQGRHEEAVFWAKRILANETPHHSRIYDTLFKKVKAIIDPNYAKDASELLVMKELKLEGCKYKEPKPFSLTLTNAGKSSLQIRNIALSCTCLSLRSAKTQTIPPGQSAKVDFVFTPDARGDVFREITFFSDAKNSMQRVEISAVVK